jgi:hypothetical protein
MSVCGGTIQEREKSVYKRERRKVCVVRQKIGKKRGIVGHACEKEGQKKRREGEG